MRHALPILVLATILLTACGDEEDTPETPTATANSGAPAASSATEPVGTPTADATTASDGEFDPCSLLDESAVSTALGGTASAERPAEAPFACRYTASQGQAVAVLSILVPIRDDEDGAQSGFEQATAAAFEPQDVTGVGEDAVYTGDQLHVRGSNSYLVVGGDVTLEQATELAEQALARLE